MKRLAPSLLLIVVAVAAVAYLLIVERARPSDAERALRAQSVLPVFRPDELTRIALDRPGDDLVLVRAMAGKRGEGDRSDATTAWSVASPQAGAADVAAVETLVGSLAAASIVRVASADTPSGTLGEPRARLELTFVAGGVTTHASLTLRGPASTPAGAAYVVRDDGTIAVATADLVTELLSPSDHFRDRVVAPYPLTRVTRFVETVPTAGGSVLELTRSGTGTFRLADGRRAARGATDALGVALADLRVETFLPSAAAAGIAAEPSRIVELDPPGGEPRATLRFGGPCPGHDEQTTVAVDAPAPFVGCVSTPAVALLSPAADTLVERHLFQAKVDEVSALILRTPGAELDLARKGSGWHERSPSPRDLDPGEADAATTLVEELVSAQGTPHPLSPELAAPDHVAILRAGDPATDEVLAWVPVPTRGAETRELSLSPEIRELLEPTARTVKALTLWDPPLDPARVAAIDEITVGCAGHEQRIERGAEGWSLVRPVATMADQAAVIDLLDAVVHARARRWIDRAPVPAGAASAAGASGGAASCAGVALAAGGQTLGCLAFGARDDEGVVATVTRPARSAAAEDGGAPSFARIDPALADRACRWFVDRHGFALPADVASVTLLRGGRRSVLVPADASADDAAAFATLDGLVADDAIHLGTPRPDDHLDPPDLEIEVRAAGGAITRLRFGAVVGTVRRATVSGVPAVFAVDAARLEPVLRAAPP